MLILTRHTHACMHTELTPVAIRQVVGRFQHPPTRSREREKPDAAVPGRHRAGQKTATTAHGAAVQCHALVAHVCPDAGSTLRTTLTAATPGCVWPASRCTARGSRLASPTSPPSRHLRPSIFARDLQGTSELTHLAPALRFPDVITGVLDPHCHESPSTSFVALRGCCNGRKVQGLYHEHFFPSVKLTHPTLFRLRG